MRKIFQYSTLFYFVLATQCQSMDAGATIAIDSPPIVGADSVTSFPTVESPSAEPMMYATKADSPTDQNVFPTSAEPMMYATKADSAAIQVDPTVDPTVDTATPMAMMMRGAPLSTPLAMVQRTATAAPKTGKSTPKIQTRSNSNTVEGVGSLVGANPATWSPFPLNTVASTAATINTAAKTGTLVGANPGTLSSTSKLNTLASTAAKTGKSTPKIQTRPVSFLARNR